MIRYPPPSDETGNEQISPSGTPYSPCETTAAEVHAAPAISSRTWLIAAAAADPTDDDPRTSPIAAP